VVSPDCPRPSYCIRTSRSARPPRNTVPFPQGWRCRPCSYRKVLPASRAGRPNGGSTASDLEGRVSDLGFSTDDLQGQLGDLQNEADDAQKRVDSLCIEGAAC
jgi:hypothetical protein